MMIACLSSGHGWCSTTLAHNLGYSRTMVDAASVFGSETLGKLWGEAQKNGWAVCDFTGVIAGWQISSFAQQLGWVEAETRTGQGNVSVLRPASKEEARKATMSSVHGLGEQPLHVDGSHLLFPPDVVILYTDEVNMTETRVCPPPKDWKVLEQARHGLFTVGTGMSTFLAPAMEDGRKWRYDPTVMRPADRRSREVATALEKHSAEHSQYIGWDRPHKMLLLSNRSVFHGRAAVQDTDLDRTLTRFSFRVGGK